MDTVQNNLLNIYFMIGKDWEEGKDKCSKCGASKKIICRCEVAKFRQPEIDDNEE